MYFVRRIEMGQDRYIERVSWRKGQSESRRKRMGGGKETI
jgi:hypothetical protein